jgi:hypothetical protein
VTCTTEQAIIFAGYMLEQAAMTVLQCQLYLQGGYDYTSLSGRKPRIRSMIEDPYKLALPPFQIIRYFSFDD